VPKVRIDIITYEISADTVDAQDPSQLRSFLETLSSASGKHLASLRGRLTICVDNSLPKQAFTHPGFRGYVRKLTAEPLGLSYFLHPESESLLMLAYAVVPDITVQESESSGMVDVRTQSAPLVDFLTADWAVAEKLFRRAGLKKEAFDQCVRRLAQQFQLQMGDWK
jgi:hypothetical protein